MARLRGILVNNDTISNDIKICDSGKDISESALNNSKLLFVKLITGGRLLEILCKNFAIEYRVLIEETMILNGMFCLWKTIKSR